MRSLVHRLSVLILLIACPTLAVAQTPYISGGLGVGIPHNSDLDGAGANREADLDAGFVGTVAAGLEFGKGLRGELELGYRSNAVDDIGGTSASGDFRTLSGMVNGLYDFDLGGPLRPFLGVGLGVARVTGDDLTPVGATRVDDSDTSFAYQLMGGVEYAINDSVRLGLNYRYFAVPSVDFDADSGAGIDSDYRSHEFMVGLRFRFPAPKAAMPAPTKPAPAAMRAPEPAPEPKPEPAPPPVAQIQPEPEPPPPPPRTYIVFFDWDSAALTPEAREIIATATQNSKTLGVVRVILAGHADRSGTRRYNVGLSRRRADAVKAEFTRLGVGAREIVTFARGESQPLVPTGDGVREPRNRRVEIELQ